MKKKLLKCFTKYLSLEVTARDNQSSGKPFQYLKRARIFAKREIVFLVGFKTQSVIYVLTLCKNTCLSNQSLF